MRNKFWVGVALLLVVGLAAIFWAVKHNDSEIDSLPNYTDYKEPIEVNGLDLKGQPSLGQDSAPVKLVEFADFKCPVCKRWNVEVFDKLKTQYIDTGKVQLYFVNYAFIDRDSILAAIAGESIYEQSPEDFWEFEKTVYDGQGDESKIWATREKLLSIAKSAGVKVDFAKLEKDMKDLTQLKQVKTDFKMGGALGVNGTPQFFINGQKFEGDAFKDLMGALDTAITVSDGVGGN